MTGRDGIFEGLAAALGLMVFEDSGGGLVAVSGVQAWYQRCFGGAVEAPERRSDFLEHFLAEAREHWATGSPDQVLRSGFWEEGGEQFEARAVDTGLAKLIVIKLAGKGFEELSAQVQRSNELSLERARSGRETQRRVVLLDCVVHDLSNPMATILVNLQFLVKRLPEGVEREAAQAALDQVERQRAMLRSIVGLFSADLGRVDEGDALADVGEAIAAAVRAQLDGAMHCGVALVGEVPAGGALRVVAEPVHLVRAIENLIVNAVRHSPKDGTVTVGADAGEDGVTIFVEDEGAGVDPGIAAGLFDPFTRGGDGGGQAGLGLFFCQRLARRWGGEIGVDGRVPGGARFWLRLRHPRV